MTDFYGTDLADGYSFVAGNLYNNADNYSNYFMLGGDDGLTVEGNYKQLYGDDGNDWMEILGGYGSTIYGGAGNDHISATGSNNTLYGGIGNDDLSSGLGSYTAFGGVGADKFGLGWRGTATIADYKDGVDKLYLDGLGFGQLRISQSGNDVVIKAGQGSGETLARLLNVNASTVTQADFV